VRLLADFDWINFLSRHQVLFVRPAPEVDQLASFGTEGPPRIVLPFNPFSAGWTGSHKSKVRRKKAKVKTGRQANRKAVPETQPNVAAQLLRWVFEMAIFGATLSGLRKRMTRIVPRVAAAATLGCICSTALRLTWFTARLLLNQGPLNGVE